MRQVAFVLSSCLCSRGSTGWMSFIVSVAATLDHPGTEYRRRASASRVSVGAICKCWPAVCHLQVAAPLTSLAALPQLILVDVRGVHDEQSPYWGAAKCETMRHLAALSKALRRRRPGARVAMDLQ